MLAIVLAAPFVVLVLIGLGASAWRGWRERQLVEQYRKDIAQQRGASRRWH